MTNDEAEKNLPGFRFKDFKEKKPVKISRVVGKGD